MDGWLFISFLKVEGRNDDNTLLLYFALLLVLSCLLDWLHSTGLLTCSSFLSYLVDSFHLVAHLLFVCSIGSLALLISCWQLF